MKARGPMRRMKRGSSMGKARPVKTISASIPSPATFTFSTRSGSTTSMAIGPTVRSRRSECRIFEACRQCSTPSRITAKWASATFRCG